MPPTHNQSSLHMAMKKLVLDRAFLRRWEPEYDDEPEEGGKYGDYLSAVRFDVRTHGTIAKSTFRDIAKWKSSWLLIEIEWDHFERYARAIRRARSVIPGERLSLLVKLRGIRAPFGSTILHFLYPDSFPIIDVRTMGVLHRAGLLPTKSASVEIYPEFRRQLLRIKRENPGWTLKAIDRALFAYHKRYSKVWRHTSCR